MKKFLVMNDKVSIQEVNIGAMHIGYVLDATSVSCSYDNKGGVDQGRVTFVRSKLT